MKSSVPKRGTVMCYIPGDLGVVDSLLVSLLLSQVCEIDKIRNGTGKFDVVLI